MPTNSPVDRAEYLDASYEMFLRSVAGEAPENHRFAGWRESAEADGRYVYECIRDGAARPEIQLERTSGETFKLINLASYNYLGLGYHPAVTSAAKAAIDRHGLGAASSPVNGGTLAIHAALERSLLDFLGLPDRGVSLFSSGYGVNTGTISAILGRRQHAILDEHSHASMIEGAQLSGAQVSFFPHNDVVALRRLLASLDTDARVVICTEGIFSGGGDRADLKGLVAAARAHGAMVLVDEAHSIGVAGPTGRGVAEEQGVLEAIDFFVITFSKALGGLGGAVITSPSWAHYINWYARCRMFSCALPPAVSGGVARALELLGSAEGAERRARLHQRATSLRRRLAPHVDLGVSEGWIVTVHYGDEGITLPLLDALQRHGLDASMMRFPAVPSGEARLRLFVTSEHSEEVLARAAAIVVDAAREFGFLRGDRR